MARIQAPSVRQGLHQFAAEQAAELLVIVASERKHAARRVLGDESRELLEDPPCAVAVSPATYSAPARMTKIGVAYDGSPESERALALARELASERHATLAAFEAVPAPVYLGDRWSVECELEEEIHEAQRQIADLGGIEPHAGFEEDPVVALRRFGETVDLFVLGAHRYRRRDGVLGGSKAQRLAEDPSSPLLVLSSASADVPPDHT